MADLPAKNAVLRDWRMLRAITTLAAVLAVPAPICWLGVACAQISLPEGRVGQGWDGLTLLQDTADSQATARVEPVRRFYIVIVREHAILLDSTTGDTWYLVFDDSGQPCRWERLPKTRPETRTRGFCHGQDREPIKARPSQDEAANPFREDARP